MYCCLQIQSTLKASCLPVRFQELVHDSANWVYFQMYLLSAHEKLLTKFPWICLLTQAIRLVITSNIQLNIFYAPATGVAQGSVICPILIMLSRFCTLAFSPCHTSIASKGYKRCMGPSPSTVLGEWHHGLQSGVPDCHSIYIKDITLKPIFVSIIFYL